MERRAEQVAEADPHERFCEQANPVLVFEDNIVPAASLWVGARRWTDVFRRASFKSGDRLVIALPSSSAFVQVVIAALWDRLTLAVLPPCADVEAGIKRLDARGGVSLDGIGGTWMPDVGGGPSGKPINLRSAESPPSPNVRFIFDSSREIKEPHWITLSESDVFMSLQSHASLLGVNKARVLSTVPWHQAFGLTSDLLPALLAGAEMVKLSEDESNAENVMALIESWKVTHLSATLHLIRQLTTSSRGCKLLANLQGGVVRGTPVSADLIRFLATTRLQVVSSTAVMHLFANSEK